MAQWLDPAAPVLARELRRAGYATGHFGKWHMGGQRDVDDAPAITEYGFHRSLTNFEGMGPKLLPLTMTPDGKVGRIWTKAVTLGKPVIWMQRSEITGGFVDAAIPFIDRAQKDGKPFYNEVSTSSSLDEEQFREMEQDLWEVKKKWAEASGLK